MIKIAICEDNYLELSNIVAMIHHFQELHSELMLSTFTFTSSIKLLEAISKDKFHLLLADIIMPEMDGIQLGEKIRQMKNKIPIIYFSSSPEFAVQSYSVNALHYLLKPIQEKMLHSLLEKIVAAYSQVNNIIHINARDGTCKLNKTKITYIEYHCHYLTFHLENQQTIDSKTSRLSFDKMASQLLTDNRFIKISSSMIVNLSLVKELSTKGLILNDNTELFITRTYNSAKSACFDYLLDKEQYT